MLSRLEAALLTRPPRLLHRLLPGAEWVGPAVADAADRPLVYLTFDDGPIPEQTPWVLAQLADYQAPATFFCVGDNLVRYPEIAHAALAAGHGLANHTQHHRSAWAQSARAYLADVAACEALLTQLRATAASAVAAAPLTTGRPLFRPPYGRLTRGLLTTLAPDYRVILWSLLTRDYDPALTPEDCLRHALAAVQPGDIIVFHDSQKAAPRLRHALPRLLEALAGRGFGFGRV